jgi:hypothetical protein
MQQQYVKTVAAAAVRDILEGWAADAAESEDCDLRYAKAVCYALQFIERQNEPALQVRSYNGNDIYHVVDPDDTSIAEYAAHVLAEAVLVEVRTRLAEEN